MKIFKLKKWYDEVEKFKKTVEIFIEECKKDKNKAKKFLKQTGIYDDIGNINLPFRQE